MPFEKAAAAVALRAGRARLLFWDGRVDASSGEVHSQFADEAPSTDPLVVAAHLPLVEIREMVPDVASSDGLKTETVESARQVYDAVVERVRTDPEIASKLTVAFAIGRDEIQMRHLAESIAEFIRDRFRLRPTRFHRFVFGRGELTRDVVAGGLLFYGKGHCATCHNGPFFSDLAFHAIPFGQFGFGRNGFGVDYGRFNVTLDLDDLYRFRTPPLYNVAKTAPYSHSGSTYDLEAAIRAHVDPLGVADVARMRPAERVEFYKRLALWSREPVHGVHLTDDEVRSLRSFLETLSFDDPEPAAP